MKKIVFFVSLLVSLSGFAQKKEALKGVEAIHFYGVDFSKAKVYDARESGEQFKIAFQEINSLFITEPNKYNVARYFRRKVLGIHLNDTKARIGAVNSDDIIGYDSKYAMDESIIKDIVSSLSIKETDGTGVIIITERIDKSKNRAYFSVVFFDINTRNIIDSWRMNAKGKGFGLRNFWARAVHEVLRECEHALK